MNFLHPGGMTDEAVSSGVDVTIQTPDARCWLWEICVVFFGTRNSLVWHPSGMQNFVLS
jgi:hypothetical protein